MENATSIAQVLASVTNTGMSDKDLINALMGAANTLASLQGDVSNGPSPAPAPAPPAPALLDTGAADAASSSAAADWQQCKSDLQRCSQIVESHLGGGFPSSFEAPAPVFEAPASVAVAMVPAPTVEGMSESINQFIAKYPLDARAYDFLVTSPPNVVATVLREFKPPREGETDYSGLCTAFTKRKRAGLQQGQSFNHGYNQNHWSNQSSSQSYNTGQQSYNQSYNMGEQAGYQASFPSMGGGCSQGSSMQSSNAGLSPDILPELQAFVKAYPIDEKAYDFIMKSSSVVQLKVLREFKPKTEGETDYSALVTSFTKRCQSQAGRGEIFSAPGPAGPAAGHFASTAPCDLGTAMFTPGYDVFFQKYPIDDRAYEFFRQSSPSVQHKVMTEFKPPREGEQSYAGIFTAFVKTKRGQEIGGFQPGGNFGPGFQQPQHGGGGGGGYPGRGSPQMDFGNSVNIEGQGQGNTQWLEGTVDQWQEEKGFGFLQLNDGRRVYIHHTVFGGGSLLQGGQVMAQVTDDPRNPGKYCCCAVQGPAVLSKMDGFKGSLEDRVGVASLHEQAGGTSFSMQSTRVNETLEATVVEWNEDRGFGFLQLSDGRKVYVHHTCFGGGSLLPGVACKTQITADPRNVGKLCAAAVSGEAVVAKQGGAAYGGVKRPFSAIGN